MRYVQNTSTWTVNPDEGNSLRPHFDRGSGSWIAPDAPSSLARVEAAEASDFNPLPVTQGTGDAVKYGADEA